MAARRVGPFKIIRRVGRLAYELEQLCKATALPIKRVKLNSIKRPIRISDDKELL